MGIINGSYILGEGLLIPSTSFHIQVVFNLLLASKRDVHAHKFLHFETFKQSNSSFCHEKYTIKWPFFRTSEENHAKMKTIWATYFLADQESLLLFASCVFGSIESSVFTKKKKKKPYSGAICLWPHVLTILHQLISSNWTEHSSAVLNPPFKSNQRDDMDWFKIVFRYMTCCHAITSPIDYLIQAAFNRENNCQPTLQCI